MIKFEVLLWLGFYFSESYCLENVIGMEIGEFFDINIIVLLYIDFNFLLVVWLGLYVVWCLKNVINVFL